MGFYSVNYWCFALSGTVQFRSRSSNLKGLALLVIVQGCFSHNEAERPHKRGQRDNDYPLHYTFSSSSMRVLGGGRRGNDMWIAFLKPQRLLS